MTEIASAKVVPATPARSWMAWTFLIILALVWGSSFILIKRSLAVFSSEQVAAGRIFLAWIFFIPLLVHQSRQPEIRVSVKQRWTVLLAAGLLGNLISIIYICLCGGAFK